MNTNFQKQQGVSLSVRGLRKSYNGIEVLKGVDFEVKAGEIFVIMGPSGCGKSVLLRQLIGLEDPDQGEVLIEGQPIQSPEFATRYRVAMVFQSGALLTSMTVGENVGFYLSEHHLKPPGEIAKIVAEDLEQVGLKGTENKMPAELSGGMRKRVAIARALAVEPQLILYDEPTSELDPVSAVNIAEEIVKLNQRIHATTVIVSHDRDLAFGIAHRIAMLDEGRIVAIGTPDEIKRNPDPRAQQFLNAKIVPRLVPPAHLQPAAPIPV
jgi:phospholipid/cholesterol/gamma-HCH transport system ATP-binding protein